MSSEPPPLHRRGQRPGPRLTRTALTIALLLITIHAVRGLLPAEIDLQVVWYLAASLFPDGTLHLDRLYTLLTAMVLHGDWTHLLFNAMGLAFFGSLVQVFMGPTRLVVFVIVTGLGGGVLQAAVHWGDPIFGIGASGAAFGLLGAGAHFLGLRLGETRAERLRRMAVFSVVMMGLLNFAFAFSGVTALFGVSGTIAWEAHLGGYLAGLALFPRFRRARP